MMAVVSSEGKQDFTHLRAELEAFGESLNVKTIQSSAIFWCDAQTCKIE